MFRLQMSTAIATMVLLACLVEPAVAQRQSTVQRSGRITVMGPPGTQVVSASGASTVTSTQLTSGTSQSTGSSTSINALGFFPTSSLGFPSPGFSFEHQAALNQNLAAKAAIDPATQHRLAFERQMRASTPVTPLIPFFPTTQVIIVQQPPVVILTEPEATQRDEELTLAAGPAVPRRRHEPEPMESPRELVAPQPAAPPPPELNEIVLVRRDGKLVFVVAYSTQGERLVYVMHDGVRRSMPVSEVDTDATRLINEERGVKFSG